MTEIHELYIPLNYRIFSQEIPSDVNVQVGEASFSLHKVVNQFKHALFAATYIKLTCLRIIQIKTNDFLILFFVTCHFFFLFPTFMLLVYK